jgi:hypothetical protein
MQKAAPFGTAFPLLATNGLILRAGQPRQRGSHSSGLPLAAYNNETFDHLFPVVEQSNGYGCAHRRFKDLSRIAFRSRRIVDARLRNGARIREARRDSCSVGLVIPLNRS